MKNLPPLEKPDYPVSLQSIAEFVKVLADNVQELANRVAALEKKPKATK